MNSRNHRERGPARSAIGALLVVDVSVPLDELEGLGAPKGDENRIVEPRNIALRFARA